MANGIEIHSPLTSGKSRNWRDGGTLGLFDMASMEHEPIMEYRSKPAVGSRTESLVAGSEGKAFLKLKAI